MPRPSRINRPLLVLICLSTILGTALGAAETSVNELLEALNSPDTKTQVKAIDELGAQGSRAVQTVGPLSELLKADDAVVRRHVVKALVAIHPGPKIMIPIFIKLMKDPDPGVQTRVLSAITEAGEAAVPGLIEALNNDEAAYWVCVVLRQIGPAAKAAAPALTEKLKDSRPDIRIQAILALGAMGDAALPAVPQIGEAVKDERTCAAATFALGRLKKIPADAENALWANAKGNNPFLSTVSIWALTNQHPEDPALRRAATQHLMRRLKDKDALVRVAAARALAALPPDPEITLPIFKEEMKDADPTTLKHALDALAMLGEAAVPSLVNILEKHKELRVEAAYTLGQMGPKAAAAVDALAKLVDDENLQIATEAIIALGKIGPDAKAAVPTLCAALMKEGEKNSHAIVFALGDIGPAASAAEPLLLEAMQAGDKSLAAIAARSYVEIQPPASRDQAAAKAVPVLATCLSDPLPETRKAAAESLAALGPLAKEARPALEKTSEDKVKGVRDAAANALKAIQ